MASNKFFVAVENSEVANELSIAPTDNETSVKGFQPFVANQVRGYQAGKSFEEVARDVLISSKVNVYGSANQGVKVNQLDGKNPTIAITIALPYENRTFGEVVATYSGKWAVSYAEAEKVISARLYQYFVDKGQVALNECLQQYLSMQLCNRPSYRPNFRLYSQEKREKDVRYNVEVYTLTYELDYYVKPIAEKVIAPTTATATELPKGKTAK